MRSETARNLKMCENFLSQRFTRLVIGYGNTLRSDDGAGIRTAEAIAQTYPELRVIASQQLAPELAADIALATQVVFFDAYAASDSRAQLRIARISGDAAGKATALGHYGDPVALVSLANRLFGSVPEAWVVGIPAFYFDAGEALSAETSRRIEEGVALFGDGKFFGTLKGEIK